MGMLGAAVAAGLLYQYFPARARWMLIPTVAIAGFIAISFVSEIDLYNQAAFTGRSQIWLVVLNYARDHWLLGSGYESFWNIGPQSPIFQYSRGWITKITSAHNGYLELLAQIGVPGLALAVWAFFLSPMSKLFTSTGVAHKEGALLLASLVFCAGHNFTESSMLERDQLVGVFLLITLALVANIRMYPLAASAQKPRADRASRPAGFTGRAQNV